MFLKACSKNIPWLPLLFSYVIEGKRAKVSPDGKFIAAQGHRQYQRPHKSPACGGWQEGLGRRWGIGHRYP